MILTFKFEDRVKQMWVGPVQSVEGLNRAKTEQERTLSLCLPVLELGMGSPAFRSRLEQNHHVSWVFCEPTVNLGPFRPPDTGSQPLTVNTYVCVCACTLFLGRTQTNALGGGQEQRGREFPWFVCP